jgi:hypothetical protein
MSGLLGTASAAEGAEGEDLFEARHDELQVSITDWFLPAAPPERLPVKDRVCRALFFTEDGAHQVQTEFCAPEVARGVRDVADQWTLVIEGAPEAERVELFEVWFVYPGPTGPTEVRLLARQAVGLDWTLPAAVDPVRYSVTGVYPLVYPESAIGIDSRDSRCRADIEAGSTGLPSEVWVRDCDPVFRDYAEQSLRRWRFDPPVLDGSPFRLGVTVGVEFRRVMDGPLAPGVAQIRHPNAPDLQGRSLVSGAVDMERLSWEPPELPRDTPLFAVQTKPYAEVEVYQVQLPEALTGTDEVECPLLLGVAADRKQQVFLDDACPEEARGPARAALKSWLLAPGELMGGVYARLPLSFIFPGSGQPYALLAANQVTQAPEQDWPAGVVAVTRLEPIVRVTPKLPRSVLAQSPGRGRCVVKVEVSVTGKPASMEAVSCPEVYEAHSLRAIKRWRWAPAQVDGQAVEATTTVSLRYN